MRNILFIALVFSLIILLPINSAFAVRQPTEEQINAILDKIEQTNYLIDCEIEKAKHEANALIYEYTTILESILKENESTISQEISEVLIKEEANLLSMKLEIDILGDINRQYDSVIMQMTRINTSNPSINIRVQQLQQIYADKIDRVIAELIRVTNAMASKMIEEASRYGITVQCELIQVEIAGRTVWVDPLRVLDE